jgi:hypothetical protein
MMTNDDRLAPLRRFLTDLVWDEAAASVRLDYDQTQTADDTETTDDICRELRAAEELRPRLDGASLSGPLSGAEVTR